MKRERWLVAVAGVAGAVAVAAGAFAAHGASGRAAEWLRTGAQYQLVHVLAALVAIRLPRGHAAAGLFLGGGALFGGTLYAMALGAPTGLGMVTPIGGAALLVGWLVLAVSALRD